MVVAAVVAVVTNVATAQDPGWWILRPPWVWVLLGFLIVAGAVVTFWVARSGERPRQVSAPEQVGAAADLLAQRVTGFWADQVVRRGIQTPAPVRVCWEWAGADVALDRGEVNDPPPLGTDPPPLPGGASGEVLSSGLVTQLHDQVYTRLRPGRLVLIGGPGAGKTGAMILLLLEALRHRAQVPDGDRARVPVPVWLTLGSWNPEEQTLRGWVSRHLGPGPSLPACCRLRPGRHHPTTGRRTGRVVPRRPGRDARPVASTRPAAAGRRDRRSTGGLDQPTRRISGRTTGR